MKEIVRRSVREFWNTGNVGVIPEIYHPDYVGHDPSGMHAGNLPQFTASAKAIFAAFSGLKVIIDDLYRVADGKVVEVWVNSDALGMLQQMGVIPKMG